MVGDVDSPQGDDFFAFDDDDELPALGDQSSDFDPPLLPPGDAGVADVAPVSISTAAPTAEAAADPVAPKAARSVPAGWPPWRGQPW